MYYYWTAHLTLLVKKNTLYNTRKAGLSYSPDRQYVSYYVANSKLTFDIKQ